MTIHSFHRCFLVSVSILTAFVFGSADTACANLEDHITRTESGFYYTVQKGDTLWDLSQEFVDSPWEWPELWRYNPQIPNPHLIYPGQKLLIFKKEWEGREKPGQVISVIDTPPIGEEPPVPPVKKPDPFYEHPEIDGVGFIRPTAVPPMGTIFKASDDVSLITTDVTVYITPAADAPALTAGDRLFTFHTIEPVRDPDTQDFIGVQHVLTGIVEITQIETDLALGRVIKAFLEISIQDRLMPYWRRAPEIMLRQNPSLPAGKIIKAADERGIMAQNTMVFIDKGIEDGVAAGDSFDIFRHETARPEPDKYHSIDLPPEYIGRLLVLHAEPGTATAIIQDSKKPIMPGDRIGAHRP